MITVWRPRKTKHLEVARHIEHINENIPEHLHLTNTIAYVIHKARLQISFEVSLVNLMAI